MFKLPPLRQSSDLTFSLLVTIFVVASLAVGVIFPQADIQKAAMGSDAVVATINLIVFGLVLILFTVTFMFVRLMLLFRENKLIKGNWTDKLNQVEDNIQTTQFNFQSLLQDIANMPRKEITDWRVIYQHLCEVDILLDQIGNTILWQRLTHLKKELNQAFSHYYFDSYPRLIALEKEMLSPHVLSPFLENQREKPLFILVVDGLRVDHWLKVQEVIQKRLTNYRLQENGCAFSVLPTHTAYARNSFFSGLYPDDCAQQYYHGELKNNQYEEKAFFSLAKQHGKRAFYLRGAENEFQKAIKGIKNTSYDVKALIFMFVDGLTHSVSATKSTEKAFRDHVLVEFKQDAVLAILDKINEQKGTVLLTSDHGSKLVFRTQRLSGIQDVRYLGEKEMFSQRFAIGTVFDRDKLGNEVLVVDNPGLFRLPGNENTHYVLATGESRFKTRSGMAVHEYDHGGISMEEVIVPKIVFESNA